MIEKNDPHQEKVKSDLSDDDLIIELTDEILISSEDDPFIESDDLIQDDESPIVEDEITAFSEEDDIEADDDDRISLIDPFDINSEDEHDVLILAEGEESLETESEELAEDGDLFDFNKEIAFEQEEDEKTDYDTFQINDRQIKEDEEDLSLLENLELDFDEEDELIGPDTEGEEYDSTTSENEQIPELDDTGELPDLIAEMEFDFEDDHDADKSLDLDNLEAETEVDGSLIAKAVEQSSTYEGEIDRIEATEQSDTESAEESELMAVNDALEKDEDMFEPEQEVMPDVEDDEELFDFESAVDLDSGDGLTSLEDIDSLAREEEDDIIEITEFDQQFPEEDEKVLEHAGVLDAPKPEAEDELEFLEIEEIAREDTEEPLGSAEHEDEIAEVESGGILDDTIEEETESPSDFTEPIEEFSGLESETDTEAEAFSAEADQMEFDIDSDEISQEVDKLDAFMLDESTPEPEVASLSEDLPEKDESEQEVSPQAAEAAESLNVSPELIASAVESVIKEKYSGQIENIIYEVIEKVVTKEIERLKGVLLEDSSSNYNE